MLFLPSLVRSGRGGLVLLLLFVYCLFFQPTLGIANSIAFFHLSSNRTLFPYVRVFGTLGWVLAGVLVGALGLSASPDLFRVTAVVSLIDLKDSRSWKSFHDVRAALGEPNYIGHDHADTYYVYYSLANSFRVGEQLLVNAPGREGSNYVPTNDVVSKGQSATIRFKRNTPDNRHTSERVKVSALGDDEALKNIARNRQLGILEYGGRVLTPEKEIEIDTNQAVFDTPWGRLCQGSVVPAGRQVTLWRQ